MRGALRLPALLIAIVPIGFVGVGMTLLGAIMVIDGLLTANLAAPEVGYFGFGLASLVVSWTLIRFGGNAGRRDRHL